MDGATPAARLAGDSLELLSAVCRLRRPGGVEELRGDRWEDDGSGLGCTAGPLRLHLEIRRRRRWEELTLSVTAGAPVEVESIAIAFRPSVDAGAPRWLVYDGYHSWDTGGIVELDSGSGRWSWWRCALVAGGGAGIAMVAGSARSHGTRFEATAGEVRWCQVAPPLGEGTQPLWSSDGGPAFESEPLRVASGPDFRAAMAACLPRLARRRGPAPRGWLSWYHLGIWVDADSVLANSQLIAAGAGGDLEPAVIQVDDGWQLTYGDWRPNTKFPDLRGLCDALTARGQVPGIWTAPFLVGAASDLASGAPEGWFVHHPGTSERLVDPRHTVFGPMYVLDPRQPAVRRHLASVFRELRSAGFRHFKIDFLYAGAYAGLAAFREGLAAIRRGAGADAYLLACGAPVLPVAGIADGCRIGPDTCTPWPDASTGEPQPTFFGDEVDNVIRNIAARADLFRWFDTDPDVAVAGGTLTPGKARQLVTAVALCGGLYFLSDDLRSLAADRLAIVGNPELAGIAAAGAATPAWDPAQGDLPQVWRRGDDTVAVFNFGRQEIQREVPVPAGLGARDVFTGARLATRDGRLAVGVSPGDVRLIRYEAR